MIILKPFQQNWSGFTRALPVRAALVLNKAYIGAFILIVILFLVLKWKQLSLEKELILVLTPWEPALICILIHKLE